MPYGHFSQLSNLLGYQNKIYYFRYLFSSIMNHLGRRFFSLLLRENFAKECEEALNKQINLELKACHDYLAMAFHFDRSDVALPGAFKFFKTASDEERKHAELIMAYMNKRGGDIKLTEIDAPNASFESIKEAMNIALNMENEVNQALLAMHSIAAEHNDPNMCDFIESHFLQEQVDDIKQLTDFITQMERVDCDLGSYLFDKYLSQNTRNMHTK